MPANSEMTPSEEHIAFYMAIGQAVTQWSFIEYGLYHVACRVFGPEPSGALAFGFMSIENFRAKLAFVDRAFGTAPFFDEFEAEWVGLRELVRSLSSRRNEIAHGRVIVYPNGKPGRRYAIVPTFAPEPKKKQRVPSPPSGSLCVRDIDLAIRQFSRASTLLTGLYFHIGGEEGQLAELVQPEPQARTVGELKRQIHAMFPPRDGSSPR